MPGKWEALCRHWPVLLSFVKRSQPTPGRWNSFSLNFFSTCNQSHMHWVLRMHFVFSTVLLIGAPSMLLRVIWRWSMNGRHWPEQAHTSARLWAYVDRQTDRQQMPFIYHVYRVPGTVLGTICICFHCVSYQPYELSHGLWFSQPRKLKLRELR